MAQEDVRAAVVDLQKVCHAVAVVQQALGVGAGVNRQGGAEVPRLRLSAKVSQQLSSGALVGASVQQLLAAARPLGGDQFAAHVVAQVNHRDREPALRSGAHINDAAQPDIGGFWVCGVAVQVGLGQRLGNVPFDAGQLFGSAGHIDGMVADQVVLGQLDALFVRAIWKDQRLNLYLSVETGADLKAACPAAVQEAPGSWVLNDHFEGGAPECGTN